MSEPSDEEIADAIRHLTQGVLTMIKATFPDHQVGALRVFKEEADQPVKVHALMLVGEDEPELVVYDGYVHPTSTPDDLRLVGKLIEEPSGL